VVAFRSTAADPTSGNTDRSLPAVRDRPIDTSTTLTSTWIRPAPAAMATPASPQAAVVQSGAYRGAPQQPLELSTKDEQAAQYPLSPAAGQPAAFRSDLTPGRARVGHTPRSIGRAQSTGTDNDSLDGAYDPIAASSIEDTQHDVGVTPSTGFPSPGSSTVQTGQVTYHLVPDVKAVTDVNTPSSTDLTPSEGTARIREAMVSVANQAVIRGSSSGTLDIPDFGRVAVNARAEGGSLNVSVSATHSSMQQTLQGHANAMVADLRHAALPVSRLTIDHPNTSSGSRGSSTADSDHHTESRGTPRREPPPERTDAEKPRAAPMAAGRVRIVL
jgi:hypothetical protein